MRMFVLSVLAGSFIAFGAIFARRSRKQAAPAILASPNLLEEWYSASADTRYCRRSRTLYRKNLIVMAGPVKRWSTRLLLRNWMIVYAGGRSMCMVAMILLSGYHLGGHGQTGSTWFPLLFRSVHMNLFRPLCCILKHSGMPGSLAEFQCCHHHRQDPVGHFSHQRLWQPVLSTVANMYFIPAGMAVAGSGTWMRCWQMQASNFHQLTVQRALLYNLLPVTLGNIVGGADWWGWYIGSCTRGNKEVVQ